MKREKTYSLRELRQARGLSIQKLAEATGLSYAIIQAIETGRGRGYNVATKHVLADYFHVPARLMFPEIQVQIDLLLGKSRQIQMFVPRENLKR